MSKSDDLGLIFFPALTLLKTFEPPPGDDSSRDQTWFPIVRGHLSNLWKGHVSTSQRIARPAFLFEELWYFQALELGMIFCLYVFRWSTWSTKSHPFEWILAMSSDLTPKWKFPTLSIQIRLVIYWFIQYRYLAGQPILLSIHNKATRQPATFISMTSPSYPIPQDDQCIIDRI